MTIERVGPAPRGVLGHCVPGVLERQRRAVVDEPGPALPDEHVGIARRAVGVHYERVEPEHGAGQVVGRGRRLLRPDLSRAVQEAKAQVQALARPQQVAQFLIAIRVLDAVSRWRSARRGTASPSASASSATMTSATRAAVPCAAPRSFTRKRPSSVSATTGHELPRLWDETMRRARTTLTSEVSRHRSHSVRRVAAGSARMARRAGR